MPKKKKRTSATLHTLPYLVRGWQVGEEPLVQSSEESKDLLIEAMRYHLMPERRSAMAGTRTSQRRPDGLRSYLFAVGRLSYQRLCRLQLNPIAAFFGGLQ